MAGRGGSIKKSKKNPMARRGSTPMPQVLPKSLGDALVDVYKGKRADMESGLPSMSQDRIIKKAVKETRQENPKAVKKLREQYAGMQEGGAVPAKFKGFSKLPEKVQQKMNPDLAQKYENGGEVRGARSAISGRGFKGIR